MSCAYSLSKLLFEKGELSQALAALKEAAFAYRLIENKRSLAYVLGVAAILGHCHPATRGFKGGKGVATAAGMVAGLHPLVLLGLVLIVFVPIVRITKKASVASLVAIALSPIGVLVGPERDYWEAGVMAGLAVYLVARHWANIVRLVRGEEHSITRG